MEPKNKTSEYQFPSGPLTYLMYRREKRDKIKLQVTTNIIHGL